MLSTRLTIIAFLAATWCWTSDGQLHFDVACPGVNSKLRCPEGQVIQVVSVHHGLQQNADCGRRNQPGEVSWKKCIRPEVYNRAKLICDGVKSCQLSPPKTEMFQCSYSDDNFIQFTYFCNDTSPDLQSKVICENKAAVIKCEKGKLDIVKARFGRFDGSTCTVSSSIMTYCASDNADDKVKKMCNGLKSCKVTAVPKLLGEPTDCDELPKYATVDYYCR